MSTPDDRLHAPLAIESLEVVAGLAAGYAHRLSEPQADLFVLADDPDPVALTVRLTHRVFVLGQSQGLPLPVAVDMACELVSCASGQRPEPASHPPTSSSTGVGNEAGTCTPREVLSVAGGHPPAPVEVTERFLNPAFARACGWDWVELLATSVAALRATVVTIAQSPVGSSAAGQVLAQAAALRLRS